MTFNVYTFQFQRILRHADTQLNDPNYQTLTDEQWEKRQDIFASVLLNLADVVFTDTEGREYLHEDRWNDKKVFVFRLANNKTVKLDSANFEEVETKNYPPIHIIIDNRDGVQRMLVQRRPKAWGKTDVPAKIIENTFDQILTPMGMHFSVGDGPVYPNHTFWQFVKANPQGITHVQFYFPPINLARLHDLAASIDAIRDETGAAYMADIKAVDGGIINLDENNPHTASLVDLSSAGGFKTKLWKYGNRSCFVIGGEDEQNAVKVEVPNKYIDFLSLKEVDEKDPKEELFTALNGIE